MNRRRRGESASKVDVFYFIHHIFCVEVISVHSSLLTSKNFMSNFSRWTTIITPTWSRRCYSLWNSIIHCTYGIWRPHRSKYHRPFCHVRRVFEHSLRQFDSLHFSAVPSWFDGDTLWWDFTLNCIIITLQQKKRSCPRTKSKWFYRGVFNAEYDDVLRFSKLLLFTPQSSYLIVVLPQESLRRVRTLSRYKFRRATAYVNASRRRAEENHD